MADKIEIDRLKDIIIEHVAKDVLILTEKVDSLSASIEQTGHLVKLVESSVESYFDKSQNKIVQLIIEQEEHFKKLADKRLNQFEMNLSDKISEILNDKFTEYNEHVQNASTKFDKANLQAVNALQQKFEQASENISKLANGSTSSHSDLIQSREKANHVKKIIAWVAFIYAFGLGSVVITWLIFNKLASILF